MKNKGFSQTSTLKVSFGGGKREVVTAYNLWRKLVVMAIAGADDIESIEGNDVITLPTDSKSLDFDGGINLGGDDEFNGTINLGVSDIVISDSANPSVVNRLKRMGSSKIDRVVAITTANKKTLEVAPDLEFVIDGEGNRENAKNLRAGDGLIQASGRVVPILSVEEHDLNGTALWVETSSMTFDLDGFRAFYFEGI